MRKFLLFIASFWVTTVTWGQLNLNEAFLPGDQPSKLQLRLEGGYLTNSSALTNSFFNGILSDGFISDELKTDVENKAKKSNHWGQVIHGQLTVGYTPGESPFTFRIGLGQRDIRFATFSSDLFSLIMRGNKPFAGQQLDLGTLQFTQLNYQQLGLGVSYWWDAFEVQVGGGVSYLHGKSMQQVDFREGNFFTEEEGTYVDISGDYTRNFSPADQGNGGWGTALDFHVVKTWEEKGASLGLFVKDLGFTTWEGVQAWDSQGEIDVRFEGVEITDFFDAATNAFDVDSLESVEQLLGIEDTTDDARVSLPTEIEAQFSFEIQKLQVLSGVKYLFNSDYDPRAYLRVLFPLTEQLKISGGAAVGGFGNLDVLVGARYISNFGLSLDLSANVVESLIVPSTSTGQSLLLALGYRI